MTTIGGMAPRAVLACALGLTAATAEAQSYFDSANTLVPGVVLLAGCTPGGQCSGPVSASHPLPVTGSFSASIAGFQPTPAYAQLAVSTGASARVALPTGANVVVYNTGSNPAFVTFGDASAVATTANDMVPPNSAQAFTIGSAGYIAAIST